LRRAHPQDLPDQQILQVLAAVRIAGQHQDAGAGSQDEHDADHRLLLAGHAPFHPRQQPGAQQGRGAGRQLHRDTALRQADRIGADHAQAGDLRDRQVDEHDASLQHLGA
jgi:hypothetical protein